MGEGTSPVSLNAAITGLKFFFTITADQAGLMARMQLVRGQLQFFGEHAALTDTTVSADWLAPLRQCEWVVYAKHPFAGPAAVLAYLSRYTHRVAIFNGRLVAMTSTASRSAGRITAPAEGRVTRP